MFSKLVSRNSRRDRKNNGLYFGSMIISIIAFYIVLSLSHQDVMIFLKKIESDAVDKLFAIIPVFYITSLVILFVLVYFSSQMQLERRKHEFGLYLTLGMRRYKLFLLLLLEDLRTNLLALGLGLPVAILISEIISLVTAKWVGLGIIGHQFSLSLVAIAFTIIGFLSVKFLALVILSAKIAKQEIGALLGYGPVTEKRRLPKMVYFLSLIVGLMLLVKAYQYGMSEEAWTNFQTMGLTILLGSMGTILLFYGLRLLIEVVVKLGRKTRLHIFNVRQIQELVIHRSSLLAICSLLIFSALCLFGAGLAISTETSIKQLHILDYTFKDETLEFGEKLDATMVQRKLMEAGLTSNFSKIIEINIGSPEIERTVSFANFANIVNEIKKLEDSPVKERLVNTFGQYDDCYLISLSGYNELRQAANLTPIVLQDHEVGLYMGGDFDRDEPLVNKILEARPQVKLMGQDFMVHPGLHSLPLVTDRAVTLSIALIVPDELFQMFTDGQYSTYVSGVLEPSLVKEKGLMQAIASTNEKLKTSSLGFESYLQNMGRQLFFIISASYITIYLAIIFLVVANTIIGVLFLMGQRESHRRFQTLIHLGATYDLLCQSSSKQINWYFGLPIAMALLSSYFGVRSLFMGILPSNTRLEMGHKLGMAMVIILILAIFEVTYMGVVKRNSHKYLLSLMEPKREE